MSALGLLPDLKIQCKDITLTFSYMTDLGCGTLEGNHLLRGRPFLFAEYQTAKPVQPANKDSTFSIYCISACSSLSVVILKNNSLAFSPQANCTD
jgi:hypothetical protein